jgi:hypothetical protein
MNFELETFSQQGLQHPAPRRRRSIGTGRKISGRLGIHVKVIRIDPFGASSDEKVRSHLRPDVSGRNQSTQGVIGNTIPATGLKSATGARLARVIRS